MAWLIRRGEVLASLEIVDTLRGRTQQMAGKYGRCPALLIQRGFPIALIGAHSFGVVGPLDVACLDEKLNVTRCFSLVPRRLGFWRPHAHYLLEAPRGAFERWHLVVGDQLEVKK